MIYFLVQWTVAKIFKFWEENHYIDLEDIKQDTSKKFELLKFSLGFHSDGFLTLCNVCGGCDPYLYNPVIAGQQPKDEDKMLRTHVIGNE